MEDYYLKEEEDKSVPRGVEKRGVGGLQSWVVSVGKGKEGGEVEMGGGGGEGRQ